MKIFKLLNPLSLALLMGIFWCQGSFAQTGGEDELSYRDQVQIMYVAYYGRPGDAGGLDFWAGELERVNGNLMGIINSFGNSMEFQDRFGDLDDEELVNNIFLQLLGRNADSGGLNFYVNGLREGRFTLASLALNVADGAKGNPEGQDAATVGNKLRAANAFSETYEEAGAPYGDSQIDDAKQWLAEVESSEASVTSVLDGLPALLEALQRPPGLEPVEDPFARFNNLEPQPWWRESAPYSCLRQKKQTSPWLDAGLMDPGGSDPLSLIPYFGNGSYLRYGWMGFDGCTRTHKYPSRYHLDAPTDPTYYSLGELDIWIDIARVPEDASGWKFDDGIRVDFSMEEAVALLNRHVARYFRRVSEDNLRITFHQGNDFEVDGDGGARAAEDQSFRLAGACPDDCTYAPGGLNRILFNDVEAATGGGAFNGKASLGLVNFRDAIMETIVHEIGHGWMAWPHSYAEVPWRPNHNSEIDPPNPYSNFYDIMSALEIGRKKIGWDSEMPSTLALNRYTAGWISPENVALHLDINATYTLNKPFDGGYQFLVINSGRPYAFTTLEVLEERSAAYRENSVDIYDPSAPGGFRRRRYEGVLVSRYDQTTGTGIQARFGPAFYNRDNPQFLADVGWGRDDFSLIADGETRDIGGGVSVAVAKNRDGSYDVTVSGGRVVGFEVWCNRFWFEEGYDTGCFLDEAVWE